MTIDVIENSTSFTVLGNNIVKIIVVIKFIDLNNVGMIEFG